MRICENHRCRKEFEPRLRHQKYCTPKCGDQASNDKHNALRKKERQYLKPEGSEPVGRAKPEQDAEIVEMYNRALRARWG